MNAAERNAQELLELLLPEALPAERESAAAVVEALRLVRSAGCGVRSPSAGVSPALAREELVRKHAVSRRAALEGLMAIYLESALDRGSFLWCRTPDEDHDLLWSSLREERSGRRVHPELPRPGEPASSVLQRLFATWSQELGHQGNALELWEARLERAAGRLVLLPDSIAGRTADLDRAAYWLDRGDPRAALAILEACASGPQRASLGARAYQLLDWARLLVDPELDAVRGPRPADLPARDRGPLPAALAELRQDCPTWLPRLPGAPAMAREGVRPCAWDRAELGAVALVEFAFDPASGVRLVSKALAPALRVGFRAWCDSRDGAWRQAREPEQELLVEQRLVVRHRLPGAASEQPLRGALGRASRALALVPVRAADGELGGWLHLEFEHHLLPSRALLERLGRERSAAIRRVREVPGRPPFELGPPSERARYGGWFEAWLAELGLGLGRRRWWAFIVGASRPQLVGSGGCAASGDGPGSTNEERVPQSAAVAGSSDRAARALGRALASGAVVRWEGREPGLSTDPESASGMVIPLSFRGRVIVLFALESRRRRDFSDVDERRVASALQERAVCLAALRFGGWHLEHFGRDLSWPSREPDFARFVQRFAGLAARRATLTLEGPRGSGKTSLARWFNLFAEEEAGETPRPFAVLRGSLTHALRGAPRGLVIEEPQDLERGLQDQLLQALEARQLPRLITCTSVALEESIEVGALDAGLARGLARARVRVPALAERRAELPEWIRGLWQRLAEHEGLLAPEFEDAALALLWRQRWPAGLRDLEHVLYALLLGEHERVDREAVQAALLDSGLEVLERLPSRRPRRTDLLAALASTRTVGGRVNKTRAAAYLGWDPDTLVTRLDDASLDRDDPPDPRPWTSSPAE